MFGGGQLQHGVAQKFQTFVISVRTTLFYRGPVHKRLQQKLFFVELDANGLLEFAEIGRVGHRHKCKTLRTKKPESKNQEHKNLVSGF